MEDKNEIWKEISGFEGLYQVSNMGRVRSLGRFITTSNMQKRFYSGRILKFGYHSFGYPQVNLNNAGSIKVGRVHQLVAEAFIGRKPSGYEVCHCDGDPKNNKSTNLRYDTPSGNSNDKMIHGTFPLGEKHYGHILTEKEVIKIRYLRKNGDRVKDIAEKFNVSRQNITSIVTRRSWKSVA